jgi:hypothetical protein
VSATILLESGAQPDVGAGPAVDVSAYAVLRLTWHAVADLGRDPQIDVAIDVAPSDAGPWRQAWGHSMTGRDWQTSLRAVIGDADRFARARWAGHARGPVAHDDRGMHLTLGLTADGGGE